MNSSQLISIAKSPVGYGIAAVIGIGAAYWLFSKLGDAVGAGISSVKDASAAAADAVMNVNAGTPYEGHGGVGTLGHAFDAASGAVLGTDDQGAGPLQQLGNWIGDTIYDWSHPGDSANISNNAASNKPYTAGTHSTYAEAASMSPTLPQYMGSPLNADETGVEFTGGATGYW